MGLHFLFGFFVGFLVGIFTNGVGLVVVGLTVVGFIVVGLIVGIAVFVFEEVGSAVVPTQLNPSSATENNSLYPNL